MLLTSLLSFALSFSITSSPISTNMTCTKQQDTIGALSISYDKACRYYITCAYTPGNNTGQYLNDVRFELHYDDNYNEYFQISYDVNFRDKYVYISQEDWCHNNYNVLAYSFSYLQDTYDNSVLVSWVSKSTLLGNSERSGYGFSGDSDVMNFSSYSIGHTYVLNSYVYLRLVDDLNVDGSDDYNMGVQDGYDSGYQDGTQQGYDTGYGDGYNNGYNTGKTDGYNQGYNTALNTHDFSFTNLFASISDTPILFLRRMFNFGIFGVSAISILFSLFTCLVFIKIIKKFI